MAKVTKAIITPAKKEMDRWEIESALSTLKRADEIRKDPKMMSHVAKHAQEQIKALGGIVTAGKAPAGKTVARPVRTLKRK
jgi:hypothetical protein